MAQVVVVVGSIAHVSNREAAPEALCFSALYLASMAANQRRFFLFVSLVDGRSGVEEPEVGVLCGRCRSSSFSGRRRFHAARNCIRARLAAPEAPLS